MTTKQTDVLVIGAGPGGYVAAIRAAQLGKKVLCVEKERLGGVCLNVGCIPSKSLIHAARTYRAIAHEAAEMGIEVTGARVDLKKTQAWKRGVSTSLSNGIGQLFKANKVESLSGTATLTGPNEATVATKEGSVTVQFQHCVLATGSRPIQIPGFAFDGRTVLDSTAALDLEELPRELVVIGGGFIGLEIGMAYAAMGSKVSVVEMMEQLLPGQDAEVVKMVERRCKKEGIHVFTKARAKGFDGKAVTIEVDGKEEKLPASHVLVSVGRRPNTENLGLEKLGIQVEKGLVKVDRQGRTSVPHVFAIGDIVPGPALAHKASKEGLVAAAAIAGDKGAALDYKALPWAVFTDPEIATVGLTEAQAREKGFDPVVAKFPYAALGRAKGTNQTEGFVKLVADRKTDLLLGVHVVGAEASNVIAEAALAIEMGATAMDLALTIHTHPTFPEAIMEAAEGIHGKMIHAANRAA